jgi:hypothetical protein
VTIASITGMQSRSRDGTNSVDVSTATPGAVVTVTVTAGQGNVLGWVGGVFDTPRPTPPPTPLPPLPSLAPTPMLDPCAPCLVTFGVPTLDEDRWCRCCSLNCGGNRGNCLSVGGMCSRFCNSTAFCQTYVPVGAPTPESLGPATLPCFERTGCNTCAGAASASFSGAPCAWCEVSGGGYCDDVDAPRMLQCGDRPAALKGLLSYGKLPKPICSVPDRCAQYGSDCAACTANQCGVCRDRFGLSQCFGLGYSDICRDDAGEWLTACITQAPTPPPDGGAALAGAIPTADGKKCGASEALTHNRPLAATTATFTWKVPANAPVGKEYVARVISLNGAVGDGDSQSFAISTKSFTVVAAGAMTGASPECKGKLCADCVMEAACSWCDTTSSTISTGSCQHGTTCVTGTPMMCFDSSPDLDARPAIDAWVIGVTIGGVLALVLVAVAVVCVLKRQRRAQAPPPAGVLAAAPKSNYGPLNMASPGAGDYSEDWLKSGNHAANPNYDRVPASKTYDIVPAKATNDSDYDRGRMNVGGTADLTGRI